MLAFLLLALGGPLWSVDASRKDAGAVWRGDKAVFQFVVRNGGDQTLRVNVHPVCGCTVATATPAIEAGQRGGIAVTLGTSQFTGLVEKEIEVETNDPANRYLSLSVAAMVKPVVEVLPSDRLSVDLPDTGELVRGIEFRFLRDETTTLRGVVSRDRYVRARIVAAGKVAVAFDPATPPGVRRASFDVTTSGADDLGLSISVVTRKGICVSPESVYLGRLSPKAAGKSTTVLLDRVFGRFRVLSASSSDRRLSATCATRGALQHHRLELRYRGSWPEGLLRRTIEVRTDDRRQPRVVVPVTAFVED